MGAKIVTVSRGLIWRPQDIERLWFFPDGSEYLRYSPHYHVVFRGGFRQNLALCYQFVIVLEGKLSIKNFAGDTMQRIDVRDQVWFVRGSTQRTPRLYAKTVYPMYRPEYETEAQWIREVR